jgi:aminoglycoside phosphotransferase (APT) family kinase protein
VSWPAAEVLVDAALVRELLHAQYPELADLPCVPIGEGFDNSLWRVGDELVARLPRREIAVPLIANETRWLPELAGAVTLRTPLPLLPGSPSALFEWPWLIASWIAGSPGDTVDDRASGAVALATFLREVHRPAPLGAPHNPYRGVDLGERASTFSARIERLSDLVDVDSATRAFHCGVAASPWTDPALWLHGDLHPGNTVYQDRELVGVVDFGDLCAGDPACDLAGALMSFPYHALDEFFQTYGQCDEDTLARTVGWAALFGVFMVELGRSDRSTYSAVGDLALANAARMATTL